MMKETVASLLTLAVLFLLLMPKLSYGQATVESEPPAQHTVMPPGHEEEPCPKGKRGGAIGGIVVGSVFWPLLPMSIPVLVTQGKKLKAHNKAKHQRRCQYAPGG
jgi:hypothetical protein